MIIFRIKCTCVDVSVSAPLVSPRAILHAREPELRPPSSPGFGFLGEINSTSSTSNLRVSSFFLSGLKACCLFIITADEQMEGSLQQSQHANSPFLCTVKRGHSTEMLIKCPPPPSILTVVLRPLMVCRSQDS